MQIVALHHRRQKLDRMVHLCSIVVQTQQQSAARRLDSDDLPRTDEPSSCLDRHTVLSGGRQQSVTDRDVRAVHKNSIRNSRTVDDDFENTAVSSGDGNHEVDALGDVVMTKPRFTSGRNRRLRRCSETVLAREADIVAAESRVLVSAFYGEDGIGQFAENIRLGLISVVDAAALLSRAVRLDERRHRVVWCAVATVTVGLG